VRANELGEVPVLMYHQIRRDGGGEYDLTPDEFRAELERLWREGYRPVRAIDVVTGALDVPAGKSPVVLTFDDSTKEQLAVDSAGEVLPETAIGIMLEFQRTHPGFELAGTFYPNREPFAGVREGPQLLRWLAEHGFELGNHTRDHIPLDQMGAEEARRQLVLGRELITDAVPEARVRTLALPLGAWPTPRSIAWRGSWRGRAYEHDGVFLVGAEPAPSPFARSFDRRAIPRIRTAPPGAGSEFGSSWWLDQLRRDPSRRFVSDGDPKTVAFPRGLSAKLEPRFRERAKPY
jgi:peptidoglycan/xylan/chitin deacetylase (PgdA/CDA1 family)